MRACPALLKLASANKTSCFPGLGCFIANLQSSLRALLTESDVSFNSDVILIGASVLSSFSNGLGLSAILGIYFCHSLRNRAIAVMPFPTL